MLRLVTEHHFLRQAQAHLGSPCSKPTAPAHGDGAARREPLAAEAVHLSKARPEARSQSSQAATTFS